MKLEMPLPISILLYLALVAVTKATPFLGIPKDADSGPTECLLLLRGTHFEDRTTLHEWCCSFDGGYPVVIEGADGDKSGKDIKSYLDSHAKSGKTMMILSEAKFASNKRTGKNQGEPHLVVSVDQVVALKDNDDDNDSRRSAGKNKRQGMPPTKGTLDTLVLKVNSLDANSPSASSLSEDIFNDAVCLKSQFAKCSYNELQIQEYIPGNGISDVPTEPNAPGVLEVTLSKNVAGETPYSNAWSAYYDAASTFGVSSLSTLFDLVLVCMPPGMGSWVAYAYIGQTMSVYNNDWCNTITAQMHEVGHSIGLHHSGEYFGSSFSEYSDQTGYMGYAIKSDDYPAMCFNPAHSWQLGWYSNKWLELVPEDDLCNYPISFTLNGIVDYEDTTEGANVILKIGLYFIGYNRATGFNEGTVEAKNQVTVTKKRGSTTAADFTELLGKLSIGDTYYIDYSGSVRIGVRYAENTNDKDAIVELFVEGGDGYSCSGVPSASPSESMSPSESSFPSSSPPTPIVCDDDQVNYSIKLQTDWYGYETSIATFALGDDYKDLDELVHFGDRGSYERMTLYDIPMCLGKNRCYLFAIRDSYGDGLVEHNPKGYVKLRLDETEIFQSKGDFGYYDSQVFCTGDHVCSDTEEIVFTDKQLSCGEYLSGKNKKKRKKRCDKFLEGDFVYNHCPETCGRKANRGPCKWLKKKEDKMQNIVEEEMEELEGDGPETSTSTSMPM